MKTRFLFLITLVFAIALNGQTPAPKKEAPAASKPAAGTSAPSQAPSAAKAWNQLVYPKLGEVKIPDIKRYTLSNGMKVFLVEDHTLPVVDGRAIIRTGGRWVPDDKLGLGGLVGTVMRTGGTKSKTGDQLDEELEAIAAHVETSVDNASGGASFGSQTGDTDKVLAIFADVLMHPEFRQDKIDLAKVGIRTSISRRNDDPAGIASREFRKLIYGPDSPYARQAEYWTIDAVKREDLIKFYERYFHPNNMMLGIRGDFNAEEMKAKLEKAFAEWKPAKVDLPPVPQADPNFRPYVALVKKDDVNQSQIRVGHLGGRYDDPDYFATSVMASVLCEGGFSSRITRHVRSEMGLAYDAGGAWSAEFDHPGLFYLEVGTKSESTAKAIEALMKEVRDIRESEVSDEELKVAKETILNQFVFNFQDVGQILDRVMTYEYYGYPADFLEKYKTNVEKVTKADVLRVAQRMLQPASLVVLTVGKDKDFDKPLTALNYGSVHDVDVTIRETKPMGPGGPGGARPAAANAEAMAQARPVLARAIQFMGGLEKIRSIKDLDIKNKAKINTPQGEIELDLHQISVFPLANYSEVSVMGMQLGSFFDGEKGWQNQGGGPQDMNEAAKQEARVQAMRQLPNLLGMYGNPAVSLDKKDGDNDVLVFSFGGGEVTVRLTVDPQGQVVKRAYHGSTIMGPADIVEMLSDYRDVGGIKMAYKMTSTANGQPYISAEATDVKVNTNPDMAKLGVKK